MKAIWNGTVVAESDDTVVVEGNHYFPPDAVNKAYLLPSNTKTMCSWKGQASYHTLFVDGDANPDAAWFYPEPREAAAQIKGRIAFWKGVQVQLQRIVARPARRAPDLAQPPPVRRAGRRGSAAHVTPRPARPSRMRCGP
jgi:uncharacterized protein (DUF427 family)